MQFVTSCTGDCLFFAWKRAFWSKVSQDLCLLFTGVTGNVCCCIALFAGGPWGDVWAELDEGDGVGGLGLLGEVDTWGETAGWSSVPNASALGDSETTRVIRCFRWHLLLTSSETDTRAKIDATINLWKVFLL